MTVVFMFPGQSSRYPEMIDKLATEKPCAALLAHASHVLGRDLRAHYRGSNADVFASNRDVQVGVFLANHLHLAVLEAAGVSSPWSLGLSLGEYNHLVHIGAIAFADALRLVEARGELYDEARDGLMVSVFPLAASVVEAVITRLGVGDRVAIGLYNSPRQQVISGERTAVERVLAALEQDDYFDSTVIEPRIPMHAPCFAGTGERLAAVLDHVEITEPGGTYVPNVLGQLVERPTPQQIRSCLVAHVHRPVRWQASVDAMAAHVAHPWFVEVGPRTVLHNLFGKDWVPGRRASTDATSEWPTHLAMLTMGLRDAG
jgi:[acyl-carrier-protein] S-malonyltransferase